MSDLKGFITAKRYAGYYVLGGNTYFAMRDKPRWLARFLVKHLLQWDWKDNV